MSLFLFSLCVLAGVHYVNADWVIDVGIVFLLSDVHLCNIMSHLEREKENPF